MVDVDNDRRRPVAATTTAATGTTKGAESPSPTQRPREGYGRFQGSKGHAGGTSMVDIDNDRRRPVAGTTTAARATSKGIVDPEANTPSIDTESHGRTSVSDVEAVVPSPDPTALSTASAVPTWEAYLAPESGRRASIEVVDAIVWDDTDIQRSDRRKWALLCAGTLLVGAVIVVVVAMSTLSWTRNKNVVINDPPSPAPTAIVTDRLAHILYEIKTHFVSPTLEQDLNNTQSPQYRAALWMAEEDQHPTTANLTYPLNQTSLDLLQFRQRYALATFYYATGGDEWKDQCNFLSPSLPVCDWNCKWDSEPYQTLDSDPFFYSHLFVNGTTMGVFCGRSVQNVFPDLPPVLDNLVVNLAIGK